MRHAFIEALFGYHGVKEYGFLALVVLARLRQHLGDSAVFLAGKDIELALQLVIALARELYASFCMVGSFRAANAP